MDQQVMIIAEAGVNHNGKFDLACKLVDAAIQAGADAIKFQTFQTEKVVSKKTPLADYQRTDFESDSQFDLIKKLELSYEQFTRLKEYCDQKKIMFLSTPDEEESLDFLADDLKVPLIKIGSGEVTNLPYLIRIAKKNRPVILSTGMATLAEVAEAVEVMKLNHHCPADLSFPPLTLLHCTTDYPVSFEEVNLKAMETLRETFKLPVGYSDHTLGIEIAVAAVSLGAKVIEKHFTLDKSLPGPDHQASLEPKELQAMVKAIRNTEKALGTGVKEPTATEIRMMRHVRKSVIAGRDLKKGRIIEKDDLVIKRPGTGISPKFQDVIIGMRLTQNVAQEEPVQWSFFKETEHGREI